MGSLLPLFCVSWECCPSLVLGVLRLPCLAIECQVKQRCSFCPVFSGLLLFLCLLNRQGILRLQVWLSWLFEWFHHRQLQGFGYVYPYVFTSNFNFLFNR